MTETVALEGVTKRYGAITAVRDLDLALRAGEVVALVGHNGAGKTTQIKMMLGLARPTAHRLAVALAPLVLAASAFSAQAQDPHAGHTMPATAAPTRPAPAPRPTPQAPARPAQDPHAGHVMPPAQTPPAADPHAGHQMPAQPAPVDPHAGHQMPAATPGQADPHAGHDMSAMSPAQ